MAMPPDMAEWMVAGSKAYWIRCRYTTLDTDVPPRGANGQVPDPYQKSPEILYLGARTVGGNVPSTQCAVARNEPLGISSGRPGQVFQVKYRRCWPSVIATILVGPLGETPSDMEGWIPGPVLETLPKAAQTTSILLAMN